MVRIQCSRRWKRRWRQGLWILVGIGVFIMPALGLLFRPGFFVSDDGRFHVYRVAALARAWLAGVLHPRLFPEFGFGYGQEVLNFYAPLSYWPGAFLSVLGMHPATAAKWTIGLGVLLAALTMFFFVRELWGQAAGMLAAIIYTYYPYHLIDAYVRGAIPELFAFIFLPLILWQTTRAMQAETSPKMHRALLWSILAWAGLVFTHNLSALLMALVIVPYALLLAWHTGRWRRLPALITSLVLAIALTAVYWLPVLTESKAVGLGVGPSRGYENHLLPLSQLIALTFSHDYKAAYHGPVTHPQNWFFMALLALITGLLIWRWQSQRRLVHRSILVFHLLLAVVAIFMTTSPSLFIWHPLTPLLGFLQYPWRFLSLATVGMAVAGGGLVPLITGSEGGGRKCAVFSIRCSVTNVRWGIVGIVFGLVMLVSLPKLPYEPLPMSLADTWFPEKMWQEDAEAGQVGATWTGEFLPRTVKEQRWALGRPREGAQDTSPLPGPPRATITSVQHLGMTLDLDTPAEMPVRLHQFHAPGWNATLDDRPVVIRASGELGLPTVEVRPAGHHQVTFAFGHTWSRAAGAWISALAVLLWASWAWRVSKGWGGLRPAAAVMVALMTILMLNSAGVGRASHTPAAVQVQVGNVAQILAADVDLSSQVPGYLEVTIYWLALKENATDYHVFVHVLDGAGQIVAQHDGSPVGGFTPTTRWRAGEIIQDTYHIQLPDRLLPGTYTVKAGMYELGKTITNLPTQPPQGDDRIDLGHFEIQAP